jgi:hypothetical protein
MYRSKGKMYMSRRRSYIVKHVSIAIVLGFSTTSLADTPPVTTKVIDPCKTEPCFKTNNGQNASAPDLKQEPRDLTLQYPGEDLTAISPKDAMNAAGKMADATQKLAEKVAGPLAGTAMEVVGKTAAVVTTTYDVANGAVTGYQNGDGVPGAVAGATKAGIAAGVGIGTTVAVTALCGPIVGVVAGACAEEATKDYLDNPPPPEPARDGSYNCAKIGICAGSDTQPTQDSEHLQGAQSEIDSILADETKKFDDQWTSSMSDRLDRLQSQLVAAQLQQTVSADTSDMSWIKSAAALALVAADGKNLSALACAESLAAGAASSQCLDYARATATSKQSSTFLPHQQTGLPFASCYIYKGPKSDAAIPLCNACCTADGRQTYVK